MDLLAFERKLDQTIARKRMEIQEAIKKPLTVSAGLGGGLAIMESWEPYGWKNPLRSSSPTITLSHVPRWNIHMFLGQF